ncbi:MAG: flagellar basal body rod protein FlgB [Lachnospiraceae bacterium]
MSGIYGNGIMLTEKVLDFLWGRQTVTLNNIANVDTPGFKSRYVTFEDELNKRVENASAGQGAGNQVGRAIDKTRAQVRVTMAESTRLDGNNVDMDQEQVDLVRTAYEYQHMVNSISNDLNRLKSAARTF